MFVGRRDSNQWTGCFMWSQPISVNNVCCKFIYFFRSITVLVFWRLKDEESILHLLHSQIILTTKSQFAMKFDFSIHEASGLICNDAGDPLNFPLSCNHKVRYCNHHFVSLCGFVCISSWSFCVSCSLHLRGFVSIYTRFFCVFVVFFVQ